MYMLGASVCANFIFYDSPHCRARSAQCLAVQRVKDKFEQRVYVSKVT